jgi:hypothetical protein
LPAMASLETCKDRELAVRPNRESGNTPASLVATASKRLGLSLSVNDSTCMSRVFNGNFSTRAKADAPNQKNLPVFEFKCVTTRDCDAFFVFGAAPAAPAAVALSKVDSNALSDLFKTQDRVFRTVNVGAPLAGAAAGRSGLQVDCSNRDACKVSPLLN